jgi:hypothetical protein
MSEKSSKLLVVASLVPILLFAALPDLYEKKRKISGPVLTDISKHSTVLEIE